MAKTDMLLYAIGYVALATVSACALVANEILPLISVVIPGYSSFLKLDRFNFCPW